jgi:hypothetical protein
VLFPLRFRVVVLPIGSSAGRPETRGPLRKEPGVAEIQRAGLLLLVTGTSLRAEEADRPLAYYLKQHVEAGLQSRASSQLRVCVVADVRWLHEEALQVLPTISLGGPGVNLLAKHWLEELPLCMAVDERFCIQMDPDLEEARASIWGMDNPDTQIAVSLFVQRYLPRFLDHCVEHAAELAALDPESGADSEAESDDDDDDLLGPED